MFNNVNVVIHRDDLNHPNLSGNKLHKLSPYIEYALTQKKDHLISFGGPFSNHLHALAWACQEHGIRCTAFIRGELQPELTPTLQDCQQWGMDLRAMDRKAYRACLTELENAESSFPLGSYLEHHIQCIDPHALLVPEGGSGHAAVHSLAQAYSGIFDDPTFSDTTYAVCACGTGATVAGLRLAAPKTIKVLGIQAVAEGDATYKRVQKWLGTHRPDLQIFEGHLGGFGKIPIELIEFIQAFEDQYQVPLDPVYNAKVLFKLAQLSHSGFFNRQDKVMVLHTGGLQGKRGM